MEQILLQVVEAYESHLTGGFEAGGVLFGVRQALTVLILDFRPLRCEPRPAFVLSSQDEAKLSQLLEDAKSDPGLAGLEPVGWYHSHTRSEVFLSESDIEIYNRFFPAPWQIAMVLRPSDLDPVRIGFFFREEDGYIRGDSSYQEFVVELPPRQNPFLDRPAPATQFTEAELGEPEFEEAERSPNPAKPFRDKRRLIWIFCSGVAALLLLAAIPALPWFGPAETNLGLRVVRRNGELRITWDPHVVSATDSTDGVLRIVEGSASVDVPLDNQKLRHPEQTYRPISDRVDVFLDVGRGWNRKAREAVTWLNNPRSRQTAPETLAMRAEGEEAQKSLAALRAEVAQKRGESDSLAARIEELNTPLPTPSARAFIAAKPTPRPTPRDLPPAPELAVRLPQTTLAPQVEMHAQVPVPPPPPKPVSTPPANPIPMVRAPAPAPIAPAPARAVPAAGKILWTGNLPRNGVLTIEGSRASTGFLTGELPGGPVRLGAYPAELSDAGLRVYTANPRFANSPVTEPAAANNGWNRTEYVYDPKSIRDLIVEQSPGAQQGWSRLVLRAGSRRLSVIVLEWSSVSQ